MTISQTIFTICSVVAISATQSGLALWLYCVVIALHALLQDLITSVTVLLHISRIIDLCSDVPIQLVMYVLSGHDGSVDSRGSQEGTRAAN
jgi:hypothetical protein